LTAAPRGQCGFAAADEARQERGVSAFHRLEQAGVGNGIYLDHDETGVSRMGGLGGAPDGLGPRAVLPGVVVT